MINTSTFTERKLINQSCLQRFKNWRNPKNLHIVLYNFLTWHLPCDYLAFKPSSHDQRLTLLHMTRTKGKIDALLLCSLCLKMSVV